MTSKEIDSVPLFENRVSGTDYKQCLHAETFEHIEFHQGLIRNLKLRNVKIYELN